MMRHHLSYLVGLTGGIGSGKTTVADLFAEHGIDIIDTDVIAHALTQASGAAMQNIQATFGDTFIDSDGAMDRNRMREHVFTNDAARKTLEAILHPMIRRECARQVQATTSAYVILVVPLLFESGHWKDSCQRTLLVDCPEREQIQRVQRRNGLSEAAIRAIMNGQMSRSERLKRTDDVIDNDGDPASLRGPVEALHRKYLRYAAQA